MRLGLFGGGNMAEFEQMAKNMQEQMGGSVLRLWLLRQLYEGQAHVDELVAAMRVNGTRPQP